MTNIDRPAAATAAAPRPVPPWLAQALAGHRASLARAITAVEEDTADAASVLRAVYPRIGRALIVGFTGTPGAGKSTLISACIGEVVRQGLSVGVIAVDPSSPLTGGAVLGDRIRMLSAASGESVFVRSLAARGHLGGLSVAASRVADVLDAAGKDIVFIESVGVGQSETEISRLAHVTVLVCAPGMGDDVQMIKAGVLETADVFAVNKADLAEAQAVVRQLQAAAHLAPGAAPPVVPTTAVTGAGVAELMQAVRQVHASKRLPAAQDRERRLRSSLEAMALQEAQRRLQSADAAMRSACAAVLSGQSGLQPVVDALLEAALTSGRRGSAADTP